MSDPLMAIVVVIEALALMAEYPTLAAATARTKFFFFLFDVGREVIFLTAFV